ncbi:hypothetical protein Ddc_11569 [Ditylenchus destructor]|nr:hypothetical protein Ddc_11569 [Ditylenchus destructor]
MTSIPPQICVRNVLKTFFIHTCKSIKAKRRRISTAATIAAADEQLFSITLLIHWCYMHQWCYTYGSLVAEWAERRRYSGSEYKEGTKTKTEAVESGKEFGNKFWGNVGKSQEK